MKKIGSVKVLLFFVPFLQTLFSFSLDPGKSPHFYQYNAWTMEEGLPLNSVLALTQTADGYLWLGTEMGLARFDGIAFELFNLENTPSITNNLITCLEVGPDGVLWIGTRGGGVMTYRQGKFESLSTEDGLLSNEVWVVKACRDGSVWFGTRNGLNRFSNGKLSVVPLPPAASSHYIKALMEDRIGRIWAGMRGGGVVLVNTGGDRFSAACKGWNGMKVSGLLQDQRGTVWISTYDEGVIRLKGNTCTRITAVDGLSSNYVQCVYEDRSGNIWFGTYGGGINVIQNGKTNITVIDEKFGLKSNAVLNFYEDHEGTLWFGTEGGGLNCLRDTRITTYTKNSGLSHDIVTSVFQDRRGHIWAGSLSTFMNRLRPNSELFTGFSSQLGLSANKIVSIAEHPGGMLWFGTVGGGISRLNTSTGEFDRFTTANGLSENFVRSLYTDPGGVLWAGTDNGGVHRFSGGRFVQAADVKYRVNHFCKDHAGRLWIGTFGNGLALLQNGKIEIFNKENGFPAQSVLGIYEDSERLLWIGTSYHGLFCYRNGTFVNIRKKDGLPDETVYCILEDGKHDLWLSSNRGIYCLGRGEIMDYIEGRTGRVFPLVYGTDDGMKSMECNGGGQPSGWKSTDGRIWFPTAGGLSVIDPANTGLNPVPPPVRIKNVTIDGVAYNGGGQAVVPPGEGKLEVRYTALSFIVPKKVVFKYRLEGVDREWVSAGTRRYAQYLDLSPGTYTFRVIACNSDGVWNYGGASFKFRLKPGFFQTAVFKLLLPPGIILFFFLFYQLSKKYLVFRVLIKKYRRSPLTPEAGREYLQKILYLIEVDNVFKDPNVSIKSLSSKLMVSPRTLSQVINEQLKKNFFELINYYRIKEARKLLTEKETRDKPILEIGYEVGFNSKSAFNRVFKDFTRMTPSQYRKKHKSPTS